MNQTAYIFDLDGTLLDTPRAIAELLAGVAGKYSSTVDIGQALATVGKPLEKSMAQLLGVGTDSPTINEATNLYRQRFNETVLPRAAEIILPGVVETLAALKDKGVHLGVATSKIRDSAETILNAAGIRAYFDVVIGHDNVLTGKPSPAMATLAAKQFRTDPSLCTMIGDSTDDILMAKAAGMRAVGVLTGVHGRQALLSAGADLILQNLQASLLETAIITSPEGV